MIAKKYRLTEREVKKVLRKRKPFFSHSMVLNHASNNLEFNRFAIVVSGKTVINAVERNFFRRVFYEIMKEYSEKISPIGNDYVFVIKKQTRLLRKDEKNVANFKKDIHFLLRKVFSSKQTYTGKK